MEPLTGNHSFAKHFAHNLSQQLPISAVAKGTAMLLGQGRNLSWEDFAMVVAGAATRTVSQRNMKLSPLGQKNLETGLNVLSAQLIYGHGKRFDPETMISVFIGSALASSLEKPIRSHTQKLKEKELKDYRNQIEKEDRSTISDFEFEYAMEEKPKARASDTHQTGEPTSNVGQQNTSGNNPDSWGMGMGLRTPEDIAKDMLPVPTLHSGQTNEWASETQSYSGVMQSDKDTLMREFQSQYTPNYMEHAFNQALDPYQGRLPLYASNARENVFGTFNDIRPSHYAMAKISFNQGRRELGEFLRDTFAAFSKTTPRALALASISGQMESYANDPHLNATRYRMYEFGGGVRDLTYSLYDDAPGTAKKIWDNIASKDSVDWVGTIAHGAPATIATLGLAAAPKAVLGGVEFFSTATRTTATANKLIPTPNPLKGDTLIPTPASSSSHRFFKNKTTSNSKSLQANPFYNRTFLEIDELLVNSGFKKVGPNPELGKGAYFHPKTGRKYYLDQGGLYKQGKELPHVDVHRMKDGYNLESLNKRKYPLGDNLIEELNTGIKNGNF